MRALASVALAGSVAIAGCGLDVGGLSATTVPVEDGGHTAMDASLGDDGPIGPPIVEDAGDDGGLGSVNDAAAAKDAGGEAGPSNACVAAIPQGWQLVAYEPARDACPAGYGGGHDEFSGATANAGACTCTCQITTQPDCTNGTIPTSYGNSFNGGGGNPTCGGTGIELQVAGNSCMSLGGTDQMAQYYASPAVPFSGGSCSGSAQGNAGQVVKQPVRYCDVPAPSAESVCEGAAPTSFAACIAAAGDVGCPAGSPFQKKTLVADDETLVCSACTACTVAGSCSNPQITFFADGACTRPVVQLPSNGTCVSTNAGGQAVSAFEYSAQPDSTCQASGSTASFDPMGPHTLCCR